MRTRIGLVGALVVGCVTLSPAGAGQAEWVQTQVAEPGTMTIVDGSRSGDALAVVGGGTVYHSTDFGSTWQPLSVLTNPPGGGSSQSFVADASSKLWYAGNGSSVSTSIDQGAAWRAAPVPNFRKPAGSAVMASVNTLAALSGTGVALAGWNTSYVMNACAYTTPTTPITTTHNGGRTWSVGYLSVPSGMVLSGRWLDASHAAVSVVEFAWTHVKDSSGCGVNGSGDAVSVWITSDGGRHWRRALRLADGWASAAWADPRTLLVVAESAGVARVYRSPNAGKTFDQNPPVLYSNPASIGGFPSLEFATGGRAWVGAVFAGMYRTDNAGLAWAHELSAADGAFYGVSDFTAMSADHAVMGGPNAILTRIGTAPVGSPVGSSLGRPAATGDVAAAIDDGGLHVVFPVSGPIRSTIVAR